jgi:hypothetical protein
MDKMEDVKLPELPPPDVPDLSGKFCLGWSAVRMREYARQAVLMERERIAQMVWPLPPSVKLWSTEETSEMRAAERRAQERGKGHYETLYAIGAAALKHVAAAIRRGQSITETSQSQGA